MLLKLSITLFFVFVSFASFAYDSIEDLVSGSIQYHFTNSPEKTAELWAPYSGDSAPIANALIRYETLYGKPISYDTMATEKITPRVSIVFLAVNYEKGVTFLRLQTYLDLDNKWSLMFVTINPEPFGLIPTMITFSDRYDSYND
ncbi:hypothetical protein [Vibrio breoganii]|uniref:hypothetical protein n=1 Tax=Vibrio breoganii TaxID=553239 RepID=UPI000C845540|nr:hypothetical protein [Vibrio breoganii]PMG90685.1 hypothetical protein BCU79_17785 [Vibrio breoganii]PMK32964.1 hypothetical protein BCU06_01835 [Vibrio breoganii]PML22904.1 hypothetical protein BCT82_16385 [Vibrio breoganii]PMM88457.1 hypothetical protein BCT44_18070 [Vibrio breoganii]TKF86135.1 hypothetical protein FCV82_15225 [Vibrio breoganii]